MTWRTLWSILMAVLMATSAEASSPTPPHPGERGFVIQDLGWLIACHGLDQTGDRYGVCEMLHHNGPMTVSLVITSGPLHYRIRRDCVRGGGVSLERKGDLPAMAVEATLRQAFESITKEDCPEPGSPQLPSYPQHFFRTAYELLLVMKSF